MARSRTRRDVTAGLATLAGSAIFVRSAMPQNGRQIILVVSFPAGTPPDLLARIIAPQLSEELGRPVVVENRAGAGGNIGTNAVAKAPPDQSMLLISSNGPLTTNKVLYNSIPYDPEKDLEPVSLLVASPVILVVDPKLPINSLSDFVAYAHREPGKLSYASVGVGTTSHITMEAFKRQAELNIVHVPYRGTPAATQDLVGGHVHVMWAIATGVLPLVQEGKVRAIAITSAGRLKVAPEIPTVKELGYPELEGSAWFAMMAPAGTPPAHLAQLQSLVARRLGQPDVREGLEKQGYEVVASDPSTTREFIKRDNQIWTAVVERAGIRINE